MDQEGTVYARKFISFSKEHDRLHTQLGRIKRNQKRGAYHDKTLWRSVAGITQDIADKTVKAILDFGNEYGVDVFVLEYLDFKGKKAVKRTHFWRYKRIYKVLTQKPHQHGLRIARVNARYTNRLSFDGSGWAEMDIDPYNPNIEAAVMNVEYKDADDIRSDSFKIFIYMADNTSITMEGNNGNDNGYYGSGFWVTVTR